MTWTGSPNEPGEFVYQLAASQTFVENADKRRTIMKNNKQSKTATLLEQLESAGLGDGLYAQALRKGLEEEKLRPGMGRASFMSTLISPEDRTHKQTKKGER
jgi:hypothetical protein